MAEMPKTIDIGLQGTPSSKAIAWAVEPCAQWHKENPGKPRFIIWTSERFAWESANDTGGRVIPLGPRANNDDSLTALAHRAISLREAVMEERFDPKWKEPRRETASGALKGAVSTLVEATRLLNVAIEEEARLGTLP